MNEEPIADLRIMEILNALAVLETEGGGLFQPELDAIQKKLQQLRS